MGAGDGSGLAAGHPSSGGPRGEQAADGGAVDSGWPLCHVLGSWPGRLARTSWEGLDQDGLGHTQGVGRDWSSCPQKGCAQMGGGGGGPLDVTVRGAWSLWGRPRAARHSCTAWGRVRRPGFVAWPTGQDLLGGAGSGRAFPGGWCEGDGRLRSTPCWGWPHPEKVGRGLGGLRSPPSPDPQPTSPMVCDPRAGPIMAQPCPLGRGVLPPGAVWGRPRLNPAQAAGHYPRGPMCTLAWGTPTSSCEGGVQVGVCTPGALPSNLHGSPVCLPHPRPRKRWAP